MKFAENMEELWTEGLANNQDSYGRAVYRYAERWAELMEKEIERFDVDWAKSSFERLSHEADTEGITGFMYGCAVNILSQVWKYGDVLKEWHNKQYNYEGDGVVNPALLTIEK